MLLSSIFVRWEISGKMGQMTREWEKAVALSLGCAEPPLMQSAHGRRERKEVSKVAEGVWPIVEVELGEKKGVKRERRD